MVDTVFSISEREPSAIIASCLRSLDQTRLNLVFWTGPHGTVTGIQREGVFFDLCSFLLMSVFFYMVWSIV
jgi:hypothetical protein